MFGRIISALKSINWKRTLGYVGLFMIFFLVFLYLTFPYDAVKNSIVAQIEDKAPIKIQVEDLEPYRLTGWTINNITITSMDDPTKVISKLNKARARVHIWPLFTGKLHVDYDLYGYGGGVSGVMIFKGQELALAANFKDLDLQQSGASQQVKDVGNINIMGKLEGGLEFQLNTAMPMKSKGWIDLRYVDLKVVESNILGNAIPDITFNNPSNVKINLKNRTLSIEEWNMTADHLDVQVSGRVTPKNDLEQSRFNITIKMKPSEELDDAFGAYGMILPEPDNQGYYKFTFTGTPQNPKFKTR